MAANPLAFEPVTVLRDKLDAGQVTAAELTEAYLDRIERFDDKLSAFVTVYATEARTAAAAADQARKAGSAVGPLHGIPVAVKDIIDMEGRVTTGGSMVWKDRVSPVTAPLVRNMVAAGMIVIGKTHTVEFAMGSFGTNQHMGTPWNPWDLEQHRIPGGSSAGSGVSVAAGMAPWAIGTDTGGSVRLPASFCGLVGLKTTIGRISTSGVLPLSTTLDTPGPMCRTVEDAALLCDVLMGPRAEDELTYGRVGNKMKAGVAGLRIARMPAAEAERADAEVLAAYEATLETLAGQGAELVDVTLPRDFDTLGEAVGQIIGAEGYSFVGHLTDDASLPVDNDVRPRIGLGREMSAQQYLKLLRDQQKYRCEFAEALTGIDAIVTPTTATAAPLVEEVDQTGTAAYYTRWVNLLQGCALAVPNGQTASGLPISFQIVCRGNDEPTALRIGWAIEQASSKSAIVPAGLE